VDHLIHVRADQEQAAPARLLEVGGVGRVGHRGGVEARPFVADDVDGLRTREPGVDREAALAIGGASPTRLDPPARVRVALAEAGVQLQVAVMDGVDQRLVQGDVDAVRGALVEESELDGRLAEPGDEGRDQGGVVLQDDVQLRRCSALGRAGQVPVGPVRAGAWTGPLGGIARGGFPGDRGGRMAARTSLGEAPESDRAAPGDPQGLRIKLANPRRLGRAHSHTTERPTEIPSPTLEG
jgi:hypothetical protein